MAKENRIGKSEVFAMSKPPVGAAIGTDSLQAVSNILPWTGFIDTRELTPELAWPRSIRTYNDMRNDAQVASLYAGMTMPIRRYRWMIDPQDAPIEAVDLLAEDLGLPVLGDDPQTPKRRRKRNKGRINFDEFMREALLGLLYGHYAFEQMGEITNGKFRYRKIAPRPPETIMQIKVNPEGGLVSIQQFTGLPAPEIPVERLIWFPWAKEGGQWVGRSMLREIYKHWLLKDVLLRVDTISHERNGAGTPIIEAPPGASKPQMKAMMNLARAFKVGESSGGAIPNGAKLTLAGVQGTLPDTLQSIRYHDEQMARAWLMMFIQLGQTKFGSKALGESLIDYLAMAQETIALWFAGIVNDHVIEDWMDWNYGEDVAAPKLVFVRGEDTNLAVTDLVALIQAGAITVDEELRAELRDRYNLPEESLDAQDAATTPSTSAPQPDDSQPSTDNSVKPGSTDTGVPATQGAMADNPLPMPARKLRRQPAPYEMAAAMNLAEYDSVWQSAVTNLVTAWADVKGQQVASLKAAIAKTNDLAKFAKLSAPTVGSGLLEQHMATMMLEGVRQATAEAKAQGVTNIPELDIEALTAANAARAGAIDQLMANSISEAAGRKALALSGAAANKAETAAKVEEYLNGLSDAYVKLQLGGAMTQAINAGRFALMASVGENATFYASEILDGNTCDPCAAVDGTPYQTLDDGLADYPTAGFADCDGGERCRGTLVAIYGSEAEASVA